MKSLSIGRLAIAATDAVKKVTNVRTIFSDAKAPEYQLVNNGSRQLYVRILPGNRNCPICKQNAWSHLEAQSHVECRVCSSQFMDYGKLGLEPLFS